MPRQHPTVVKAANAADFLSLLPRMLGFTPTQSVVIVPFQGSRTLGAMRFDLPDQDLHQTAGTMVGMACRVEGCDRIAAVVYSDAADTTHAEGMLAMIQQRADQVGLEVADLLYLTAAGWGSTLGSGPHPLSELDVPHDELSVTPPAGDQAAGAVLPEVTQAQQDEVALAYRQLAATVDGLAGAPTVGGAAPAGVAAMMALALLEDLPALYEQALGWPVDQLPAENAALLSWLLLRPSLRDIGLVGWVQGYERGGDALDAQLAFEEGAEYPAELARMMWGDGPKPDGDRLTGALALCRQVAALSEESLRPGPLAVCAWLAWALGRSTQASVYAEQALAIEPGHGLSEIVRSFVHAGHLPDWAFAR